MKNSLKFYFSFFILLMTITAHAENAQEIVEESFNYMRGRTSVSTVKMTIHREDWERSMTIKAFTKGTAESLFEIVSPAKDKGNATLKKGIQMWIFNPKVNRVIKLPPSMMSQSWMGSDFSNNDLAKSDTMINDYVHTIEGAETHENKKVYIVKSIPKPEAPVVWGMMKLKIREDRIMLQQDFYDEDNSLVKSLTFDKIEKISDKLFPMIMKMIKADNKNEYTLVEYIELSFNENLKDNIFTVTTLKNIRR